MTMQVLPFFDPDHEELRQRARAWVETNLLAVSGAEADIEHFDVLIVGAGLSGIVAAYQA